MYHKDLSKIGLMALVVIATVIIADRLLGFLNLSIRNMEFKYIDDNMKQQRWVQYMTPLAKDVGSKMGIPWQAIVVQTALETGWGKSSLFQKYNNYGGIKAVGNEPFVVMPTREVFNGQSTTINSKFRKWNNKLDGLMGYASFFHRNPRYKEALKHPNDPFRFIEEIKKAGYATATDYVPILHGMINKYFT